MLKLTRQNGIVKIWAQRYALTVAKDRPYVYLNSASGERLAELFVFSSIHPVHGRDDSTGMGAWEVEELDGEILLSISVTSSVWQRKTYRFHCLPQRLTYEVEVEGAGQLSEVNFFGGFYSGQVRWGSGYCWSGQYFLRGFTPEPNQAEESFFAPGEGAAIDLMGVPLPGKSHWFFTPPPFLFAFQSASGWLGMGVEAQMGENRFTEYGYHGRQSGFHLSLAYDGHTEVSGRCLLPAVGIDFGADPFEVLEAHVQALQVGGYVSNPDGRMKPAWWYEPIFCGWGAQSYVAAKEKGAAPSYARQELYDGFLNALEAKGIEPGIVVLDDKWQATYGNNEVDEAKWPDLAGFIRRQHALDRKVLLWLKAWDPEGVPVEECIKNAAGLPLAVDPTHPLFELRLRESVRYMLSSAGYDADGFKIDFTARIPAGPGICTYGNLWGLELMRCYLEILYDAAKQVKRDALVMAHTPHPYLADVIDMIRLNDMNTKSDINQAMSLRAKVASIACPTAIIDTDNWPVRNRAAWRRYVQLQPDLGVPSLYFATHIDSTKEPLREQDYELIRTAWARHRAKLVSNAPINLQPNPLSGSPVHSLNFLGRRELAPVWRKTTPVIGRKG